MPLVKVNLLEGRSTEEKELIAASIQSALVRTLEVPDDDRYHLLNEYDRDSFRHTSGYLDMTYSDQLLIIEITFLEGRDDEVKKSLLAEINRNLVAAGVVAEDDVFVLITEIGRANVSFGKGIAQRLRPRRWPAEPVRTRQGSHLGNGLNDHSRTENCCCRSTKCGAFRPDARRVSTRAGRPFALGRGRPFSPMLRCRGTRATRSSQ